MALATGLDRLSASLDIATHAARFTTIAINQPPGVLALSFRPGGALSAHHPELAEPLGYSRDEFTRQPFLHFIHPEDHAETLDQVAAAMAGEPVAGHLARYRRRDGRWQDTSWDVRLDPKAGSLLAVVRLLPLERGGRGGPSLTIGPAGQLIRTISGGGGVKWQR